MNVEIRLIDTVKGNGLFAKKAFKAGSVIFEENPLVCCQFSWNKTYGYRACDYCLRPLETAEENARRLAAKSDIVLPYPELCTTNKAAITSCASCGLEYCTQYCQNKAAEQYHKILCTQSKDNGDQHPLDQLNEAWKQMHYPPETSTIMIIPRIIATILQSPNRDAATAQFLRFCHRSVSQNTEIAHKLLGQKFAGQISTLYNLLLVAVPNAGVEQLLTPEGFESLLALIGTNGQGVGTSPISQWVTKSSELPLDPSHKEALDQFIDKLYEDMDAHAGNFLNNEGVALFALQSSCNHSCIPNAEPTYLHNNSHLSMVALRDIQEGEEICISYLDECSLSRSRHSRIKELKENYLFVCNCEACESQLQDPDLTSDEEEEEMSE